MALPLFGYPLKRGLDRRQAVVQREPRSRQGRAPVVGQRAPDRQTVPADRLGLGILACFHLALDRADASELLLELLLGVAVGLVDRLSRLPQVVELEWNWQS